MEVALINIGDELLLGQTINTNAAYIGRELYEIGYPLKKIMTIADEKQDILSAINLLSENYSVIIMTGGLGPTRDDITKNALAHFFKVGMTFHPAVYDHIKNLFQSKGKPIPEVNKFQAELPSNAIVLHNQRGTAPGMKFQFKNTTLYVTPGVPSEMQYIFQKHIKNDLHFKKGNHRLTILTSGIGESYIMECLDKWEVQWIGSGGKIAYLPSFFSVKLRLEHSDESLLLPAATHIKNLLKPFFIGLNMESLSLALANQLKEKKLSIATAESCTGGNIAHQITLVPECSSYYLGSIVSYHNDLKINQLGVSEDLIQQYGAVSIPVVEAMAVGLQKELNCHCVIATSGIAGPSGGTKDKPVGTICIAVLTPKGIKSKMICISKDREINIKGATQFAFHMMVHELINF